MTGALAYEIEIRLSIERSIHFPRSRSRIRGGFRATPISTQTRAQTPVKMTLGITAHTTMDSALSFSSLSLLHTHTYVRPLQSHRSSNVSYRFRNVINANIFLKDRPFQPRFLSNLSRASLSKDTRQREREREREREISLLEYSLRPYARSS